MPKEYPRSRRVADQIQRELSELIYKGIKDPRLNTLITITDVEVSQDLGIAKVFLSFLNKDEVSMGILNQAAGFLRHELGKKIRMRKIPELRFILDSTVEKGAYLSDLIEQAMMKDRGHSSDQE